MNSSTGKVKGEENLPLALRRARLSLARELQVLVMFGGFCSHVPVRTGAGHGTDVTALINSMCSQDSGALQAKPSQRCAKEKPSSACARRRCAKPFPAGNRSCTFVYNDKLPNLVTTAEQTLRGREEIQIH